MKTIFTPKVKLLIYIVTLFTLSNTILFAQSAKIVGKITDKTTGEALFGAIVVLKGTSIGTSTNFDGNYVIPIAPAGKHEVSIRYIGYEEQTITVDLVADRTLTLSVKLEPVAIQGREIVVSAQAVGQKQAINQQIASNTIKNVISSARIQELPDATAAESLGRLPGVSISRSGGEANKILVRGLVPQIQIDGVSLGSVDQNSRNSDISMISPNMLDGIELTKALTADMEADRLGGTVNLTVRKAPKKFSYDFMAQGGFDSQRKSYKNYKIAGSVSNRFFEDKLGVYFNAYVEARDRGTDILNPGWSEDMTIPESERSKSLYFTGLTFTNQAETRTRYGAALVLDYELPFGEIKFTNFASRMNKNSITHNQSIGGMADNGLNAGITKSGDNFINQIANRMLGKFDLFTGKLDIDISHNFTGSDRPDQRSLNWTTSTYLSPGMKNANDPLTWINLQTYEDAKSQFRNVTKQSYESSEREFKLAVNYELPFSFEDIVTGSLKAGGLLKSSKRSFDTDQQQVLVHGNNYSNIWAVIAADDPKTWVHRNDLGQLYVADGYDSHFDNSAFFDGQYHLQKFVSLYWFDRIHQLTWDTYQTKGLLPDVTTATFTNDQDGTENMNSGYFMPTLKFLDNFITFIPGIRYEKMIYEYSGYNIIVPLGVTTNERYWTEDKVGRKTTRTVHENWFPMVHLKLQPVEWADLRFAYTKTAQRPNYGDIVPSSEQNANSQTISRGNPDLKPQLAENFDLYASFYTNSIGFFSAGVFKKNLTDGISTTGVYLADTNDTKKFNLPAIMKGYTITTPMNNQYMEYIRGMEFDWQTHFWYLPFPLDGLVLNINYTYFESLSQTYFPFIKKLPGFPPRSTRVDSSYTTTQFKNYLNISVGYDYAGFSARVSYLYQAAQKTSAQQRDYLNTYKFPYSRWDVKVKQKLPLDGLEVYLDINNLTNTGDRFYMQQEKYLANEEIWGMTADFGVRYRL